LSLLVDTSVWSLVLRRNAPADTAEAARLAEALQAGEAVLTTGLVLQELLQGFAGPRDRDLIVARFAALPLLTPDRRDHIEAAELRNRCRRHGLQIGTIDALLAQLCLQHDLTLLTTDNDFRGMARHCELKVWS
jgi:predicted nucleic acid-binding protein